MCVDAARILFSSSPCRVIDAYEWHVRFIDVDKKPVSELNFMKALISSHFRSQFQSARLKLNIKYITGISVSVPHQAIRLKYLFYKLFIPLRLSLSRLYLILCIPLFLPLIRTFTHLSFYLFLAHRTSASTVFSFSFILTFQPRGAYFFLPFSL